MNARVKTILAPLASLKLTVVLLAMSMILIYAGTWAQIDAGIWLVQKKYFHSLFTWINFATFLPRPKPGEASIPGGFPMLGGYALGLLLLLNLIAAHTTRFKFSAKRIGVILIHAGLILLLVGEGITSTMAVESQMVVDVGSSASFSMDTRTIELALTDPTSADHDDVITIPESRLRNGETIKHSAMPVEISVDEFFPNSALLGPKQAGEKAAPRATAGEGVGVTVEERPRVSGTESDAQDAPSAYITLQRDGQSLGTYLVSMYFDRPQELKIGDKTWQLALRFKRLYKPYTVHLIDFSHDKYLGTDVAKNFSSHVRLVDPTQNVDREVRIWMNNPLRDNGETFYQSGFRPGDKTTILQIVRNPGWLLPYVACTVGAAGLCTHFGIVLVNFLRKRAKALPVVAAKHSKPQVREAKPIWARASVVFPAALTFLCLLDVLGHIPAKPSAPYDLNAFGQVPVSHEGRVLPLDTLARNSLKVMLARESFYLNGERTPAIQWLTDLWTDRAKADSYDVFRIDFPDLISLLELSPKKGTTFQQITGISSATPFRFSMNDLKPTIAKLDAELKALRSVPPREMSLYQRKLSELGKKLNLYIELSQFQNLYLVASGVTDKDWHTIADVVQPGEGGVTVPHGLEELIAGLQAYDAKSPSSFNENIGKYLVGMDARISSEMKHVRYETFFNRFDPFTNSLVLYIIAFLLVCLSWLGWSLPLRRAAYWIVALSFVVHTFGLISRIYISGRPPVTNLASSAIFIAWGVVALASMMEFVYRNGIAIAAASVTGFVSLLIAYKLSLEGDTMKVLVAVLDTNVWLATHVIIVVLGYAATFLAGMLGVGYVTAGLFTRSIDKEASKELGRMIYGVACFAILFSFVGTVLGGIWADQSWGRFWGWDPKENGAVLIVLSNAILLHARWGGLVRERGIACLAIFGNIVTSWSWFGTNMLGVGLHSYGFMDSALKWLLVFVASQVALILAANLPMAWWRSHARLSAEPRATSASRAAINPA